MALSLAAGAKVDDAARIGIDAAEIAVTKRWTSLVYYQELLQRVSLRDYAALPGSLTDIEAGEALQRIAIFRALQLGDMLQAIPALVHRPVVGQQATSPRLRMNLYDDSIY